MTKIIKNILLSNELFIFYIFFILYKLYALPLLADPDVAWHIAAGRLIINGLNLPQYDTWTFIQDPQKWYNISWLWDILAGFLCDLLQFESLYTLNCLLHTLLLILVYISLKLWVGEAQDLRLVVTSLVGIVIWEQMLFRPQLAGYFLTLTLNIFLKLNRQRKIVNYIYPLPLIIILWVNIHGSFILGIGIICAYLLEALFYKELKRVYSLIFCLIVCLVCTYFNPYKYELYYAINRTFNSEAYKYIAEWQSFVFGASYGTSLIICVFLLLNLLSKRGNSCLVDKLLAFVTLIASLNSIRYFVFFAILAAPYLASELSYYIRQKQNNLYLNCIRGISTLLGIVACVYFVGYKREIYKEELIAYQEINYIKQHYPRYNVFNHYNIGGYLAYYAQGSFQYFIDGRAGTAFTEELIKDYLKFHNVNNNWQEIFAKYSIDAALINHQHLRILEVSEFFKDWREVYYGKYGKVFIK